MKYSFLKSIFCRHSRVRFVRNIYGDEINHTDGMRSLWECQNCGVYRFGFQLQPETLAEHIQRLGLDPLPPHLDPASNPTP